MLHYPGFLPGSAMNELPGDLMIQFGIEMKEVVFTLKVFFWKNQLLITLIQIVVKGLHSPYRVLCN